MDPHHQQYNFQLAQAATGMHAEPNSSPPQSVPGRRTPLGAVGLGGFYGQPGSSHHPHPHNNSNENRPMERMMRPASGRQGGSGLAGNSGGKHKNRQGKVVRLNINARYFWSRIHLSIHYNSFLILQRTPSHA